MQMPSHGLTRARVALAGFAAGHPAIVLVGASILLAATLIPAVPGPLSPLTAAAAPIPAPVAPVEGPSVVTGKTVSTGGEPPVSIPPTAAEPPHMTITTILRDGLDQTRALPGIARVLRYRDLIETVGDRHDVPASLVAAMVLQESSGSPDAEGPMNYDGRGRPIGRAQGLLQVLPVHFLDAGIHDTDRWKDPETNLDVGSRLLRRLYDRTAPFADGSYRHAVAAYFGGYNWGTHEIVGGLADTTGASTTTYLDRVFAACRSFRFAGVSGSCP